MMPKNDAYSSLMMPKNEPNPRPFSLVQRIDSLLVYFYPITALERLF